MKKIINNPKVLVLSGAGISAESGISTFREEDGLWNNYKIEEICMAGCLEYNRAATIDFYDDLRLKLKDKKPNSAHKVIASLKEKYGDEIAVLTQNIDDMFEKAGCKDVVHLHGSLKKLVCESCGEGFDIGYEKQDDFIPNCPSCGGKIRPDIVFFGEQASMYRYLEEAVQTCTMVVVIGTSGNVIGVNTLAAFAKYSVLNNLKYSSAIEDQLFSKVIYKKATEAIDEIAEDIIFHLT